MPKPIDATSKTLLETSPEDWPVVAGYAKAKVTVVDADASAVSGGADKVLRVKGKPDWIMHIEFQRGPDQSVPQRAHLYNTVLGNRHKLLVRSVVVLLSRKADLSNLTGMYQCQFKEEAEPYLTFRYQVIRVWQLPAETFLNGGLALLPLAPISAVPEEEVPAVIDKLKARLDTEAEPGLKKDLWMATYLLLGLRFTVAVINNLLQGVMEMEESFNVSVSDRKGHEKGHGKGHEKGSTQGGQRDLAPSGLQEVWRARCPN